MPRTPCQPAGRRRQGRRQLLTNVLQFLVERVCVVDGGPGAGSCRLAAFFVVVIAIMQHAGRAVLQVRVVLLEVAALLLQG
jgi:hypothetical protein